MTERSIPHPLVVVDPLAHHVRGVSPEVAQVIEETLRDGRRHFGVAGPAQQDPGATLAEPHTSAVLRNWLEDKPGAVLVESAHIRGWLSDEDEEAGTVRWGDTNHIVLVGSEVILIETKRWESGATYSVGDNGEVLRADTPFPGGNVSMPRAIHLWLDHLHDDASIVGIVCINAEDTEVFRNRNWYTKPYRLVEMGRFIELLDEKWRMISNYDKTHINSTLVAQVAVACAKPIEPQQ